MTRHRLVFTFDAEIVDESFTPRDLVDNAVMYLDSIITRAENARPVVEDSEALYRLDVTDSTLYLADDFVADLADLAAAIEDDEQAERNQRADLCDECKPVDHATCSMDASCACCRTTIAALEEENA